MTGFLCKCDSLVYYLITSKRLLIQISMDNSTISSNEKQLYFNCAYNVQKSALW